ncbi:MAG: 2-dehydropantoate 2-reductase [Planctomycetota bacterium]|jgi:2-dehydropantoate 2-reductase|nr:2-dehydropantoate 2-reductase [Planctomycetota bacterium]
MSKCKLSDGAEIFCREWQPENPNGEVVLLLHGVESHAEWFDETAQNLLRCGFAVFAYDRPGWGHSDGAAGDLTAYAVALRQLEEIGNALRKKHSRLHLAGLSWGGMFAAYAALRRGLLFDSVALIAPGICPRRHGLGWLGGVKTLFRLATGNRRAATPLLFTPSDFTTRRDKAAYIQGDTWRNHDITASFAVETFKMRRFIRENIAARRLPPATLLLAQNDAIIDNTATRECFAPTAVEVVEVPQAAHSLVFEAPATVAQKIAETAARRPRTGKKIAVLGAGAVGGYLGGALALGGNDVTLIARQASADAVQKNGLLLKVGASERRVKENLRATTTVANEVFDLLIVAVKSYDTEAALAALCEKIPATTTIVSVQNGVGNEEKIAGLLPQNQVFGGVVVIHAQATAPGEITVRSDRCGLAVGRDLAGVAATPARQAAFDEMVEIFRAALGLEIAAAPSVAAVKWSKLAMNAAFNAVNAVSGLSPRQMINDPRYGPLSMRALQETFAVMRAADIAAVKIPNFNAPVVEKICRLPNAAVVWLNKLAAKFRDEEAVSSMRQDLQKGSTRTEIAAINGAVAALGERVNVPTPANRELCALVEKVSSGQ